MEAIAFWTVLTVLVAGLVLWIRRVNARHRAHARARIEALRDVARASGFNPIDPPVLPRDMPAWSVATPARRGNVLLQADRGPMGLVVLDHVTSGPPALGYNNETTGGSDDRRETSRHTVVCLRHQRRPLPRFELVPNMSRMADAIIGTAMAGAAQATQAPPGNQAGAGVLQSMARLYVSRYERAGAIGVGRPALEAAYRVYGEDASAIAAVLTDAIEALVLGHPGLIVAADGVWLALSRNVRLAPDGPAEDLSLGLLSPAQVEDLLRVTLALAEAPAAHDDRA